MMNRAAIASMVLRRVAPQAVRRTILPGTGGAQLPVAAGYAWQAPAARHFHFTRVAHGAAGDAFLDKGDTTARILTVVKNFEKVDPTLVTATARFKEDLSLDSLDAVEVVMAIEDEFAIEIPDAESDKILSIEDAVNYVISHPMAK